MDRITKSLLDEFSQEAGVGKLAEDKRFEHFAAYLTVSKYASETFDVADVVTGAGSDMGIDAIAIIVNGALVDDPDLVEELAETNGYLEVTFIFVQAKRTSGFDMASIGQFGFGVLDFFKSAPSIPQNQAVKAASAVMNAIYAKPSRFKRGNPACKLNYVTTGTWTGDQNLEARRVAVVQDLIGQNIFRDVDFTPIGAAEIQRLYSESKNAVSRDFEFPERVLIPGVPGVKEAYLGWLKWKDFLPLLHDESGEILKGLFYDNVRDFQDYNSVNTEIKSSLESAEERPRFALMNNGVTIIAKNLATTGDRFHIEDYQIVNGCQTSHVLYDNRHLIDDAVVVPLRLIATDNEEITSSIVKATNRQTEVREDQLIALSDFQKRLEAYFGTFDGSQRLYYERRSKQYNSSAGVEKTRIVTPSNLIRAFASCFLSEPHRTTRSYRLLQQQVGKTIFAPSDRLEPYYYAASAHYRIEFLFRNGQLSATYKPARYHILMAARLLTQPDPVPRMNSREMEKFCTPLIASMWDVSKAENLLQQAAGIVSDVAAGNFERDSVRIQKFTEDVKKMCAAFHSTK